MIADVSVAILAGGLSRRMGTNKSFLPFAGKPLIAHVIERVSALQLPVILITNTPERYTGFGLPMHADIFPGQGALGGLYTAIEASASPYTLCVACDMPFLNADLLRYMLSLRAGVDGVVPCTDGHYESLHAVYRRTCLPVMRNQIAQGQLRINALYPLLHIRRVTEAEVTRFDPDMRSFVNLNTPDDAAYAQVWTP